MAGVPPSSQNTFPTSSRRRVPSSSSSVFQASSSRARVSSFSSEYSTLKSPDIGTPTPRWDVDGHVISPRPRLHELARDPVAWLYAAPSVAASSRPSSPAIPRHGEDASQIRKREKERMKEREERFSSPARRWVRWMGRIGAGDRVVGATVGAAVLARWLVSLGGYSGENNPPMHGDYEAQRHWMELTLHLPPREWYYYDLPYWGLDYPPLTAYVSWVCGWIGSQMNEDWFAIEKSRGYESPSTRVYMRATVLVLDLAIYIPCVVLFCRRWFAYRSRRTQELAMITLLLQPALILVDHGHFQYNSVMLGLSLYAMLCFREGKDLLGAAAFVASMAFKQMALYYAPAVFGYLFGKCLWLGWKQGPPLFLGLAVVSTATLLLTLLPFLPPLAPLPTLLQLLHRVFPVARGLFEDKVANFWCASDPIVHWRRRLANDALVRLAAIGTVASASLSMIHLLRVSWTAGGPKSRNVPSPALRLLPWAMFNSAMAFFLFSFQVHEKSVLLPLLPLTLLLGDRGSEADDGDSTWEWGVLLNNMGVLTMWPLLAKDGQAVNYFDLPLLWNYAIGYNPFRITSGWFLRFLTLSSYTLIALLHIIETTVPPPARYPDLWVVSRVAVGCAVFGLTWLWGLKKQVEVGWGVGVFHMHKPAAGLGKAR